MRCVLLLHVVVGFATLAPCSAMTMTKASRFFFNASTPSERHRPMLWVHVHKSGGTFMCNLAVRMGERIVLPSKNCNWIKHDGFGDSGTPGRGMDCAQRARMFKMFRFSWAQIERELWDSDLCWDDFDYGVVVRQPLQLIESMINYHPEKGVAFLTSLREVLQEGPGINAANKSSQTSDWKFLDNYQTRILASAMEVPPGKINGTHVALARERLARFLVVGRLEDLQADGRKIYELLGWSRKLGRPLPQLTPLAHRLKLSAEDAHWLEEVNKHDLSLYSSVTPY